MVHAARSMLRAARRTPHASSPKRPYPSEQACDEPAVPLRSQLCNEPSKEIEPRALVEHYVAAARAIRENGMTADRVAVICPLYYTDDDDKEEFFRCWYEAYDHDYDALDNCVIDVHPYYFGDWCNSDEAGPLIKQVRSAPFDTSLRRLSALPSGLPVLLRTTCRLAAMVRPLSAFPHVPPSHGWRPLARRAGGRPGARAGHPMPRISGR